MNLEEAKELKENTREEGMKAIFKVIREAILEGRMTSVSSLITTTLSVSVI